MSSFPFSLEQLERMFSPPTLTRDYFSVLYSLGANVTIAILLKMVSQWSARITKSSGLFSEEKKLPLCHFDSAYNCFSFEVSLQFCDTVIPDLFYVLIIADSLLDSLSFVFGSFLFSCHLLPLVTSFQPLYILKCANMSCGEYTDARIYSILGKAWKERGNIFIICRSGDCVHRRSNCFCKWTVKLRASSNIAELKANTKKSAGFYVPVETAKM